MRMLLLKPLAWGSKKVMNKGIKYGIFAFAGSMLLYEGSRIGNWLFGHFNGPKALRAVKANLRHISHPRKASRTTHRTKHVVRRKVG